MKCELSRNLMSLYIDNEISQIDRGAFEKHLQHCNNCREEYELMLEIVTTYNDIEEAELPDDFHQGLHDRLVEAKADNVKKTINFFNKYRWRTASGLVAVILIIAVAFNSNPLNLFNSKSQVLKEDSMNPSYQAADSTGISAAQTIEFGDTQEGYVAYDRDTSVSMNNGEAPAPKITSFSKASNDISISFNESMDRSISMENFVVTNESQPSRTAGDRKIVKSGSLSLKVTDLSTKVDEISNITNQSGGYVENSHIDNYTNDVIQYENGNYDKTVRQTVTKSANITIRVPEAQLEAVMADIKNMGEVQNQSISGNDITSQYRDTEASLANLRLKEEKLQDLLKNKASTVDEILRIENELNNVRTSIDITEGSLKGWDNIIELSTVYIYLTEITKEDLQKVDVPGTWEKAKTGFIKTINNLSNAIEALFVWFIASIPYILIIGIPAIMLILIFIRKIKSKK